MVLGLSLIWLRTPAVFFFLAHTHTHTIKGQERAPTDTIGHFNLCLGIRCQGEGQRSRVLVMLVRLSLVPR